MIATFWVGWRYGVIMPRSVVAVEHPVEPPVVCADCPARVVLLGTSLFRRGAWPEDLQQQLSACRAAPFSVDRVAKSGAASDWGREQLQQIQNGDIVVIGFAQNDASLLRGMGLRKSRANHVHMITALQAKGATVVLSTLSPAYSWRGLTRLGLPAYQNMYRALSSEMAVHLSDDAQAWEAIEHADIKTYIPDGLHPTDGAMRAVTVPAYVAALSPMVCD